MKHISQIDLDALRLGLLDDEKHALVSAHLADCERCTKAYAEITQEAEAFAGIFNTAGLAADALDRHASRARPRAKQRWWAPVIGLVAASVLAVLVWPRPSPTTRTKGKSAAMELFVHTPGGPAPAGEWIAPRSSLRLRFDPGDFTHFRVLWETPPEPPVSLYPDETDPAALVQGNGPRWLAQVIDLDESRATERVHLVACPADFSSGRAARIAQSPALAPECSVRSLTVRKGPP